MDRVKALELMTAEAEKGFMKHGQFNSRHEGYAVIKEELEELWDDIKGDVSIGLIREEAVHTGAMILRFLIELC